MDTETKTNTNPSVENLVRAINDVLKNFPLEYDIVPFDKYLTSTALTVKYPNITVRNSRGESKFLGDVYIRFKIQYIIENCLDSGIRITAETATRNFYLIEDLDLSSIANNEDPKIFSHSHINQRYDLKYKYIITKFCYGTSLLNTMLGGAINLKELPYVLVLYKKFLEWESLEGIPYVQIGEIGVPKSGTIPISIPTMAIDVALKVLEKNPNVYNPFNLDLTRLCDGITVLKSTILFEYSLERLSTLLFNTGIKKFDIEVVKEINSVHIKSLDEVNKITISDEFIQNILNNLSVPFKGSIIKPELVIKDNKRFDEEEFEKTYTLLEHQIKSVLGNVKMVKAMISLPYFKPPSYSVENSIICFTYSALSLIKPLLTKQ